MLVFHQEKKIEKDLLALDILYERIMYSKKLMNKRI